jgi:hypothetical protein
MVAISIRRKTVLGLKFHERVAGGATKETRFFDRVAENSGSNQTLLKLTD